MPNDLEIYDKVLILERACVLVCEKERAWVCVSMRACVRTRVRVCTRATDDNSGLLVGRSQEGDPGSYLRTELYCSSLLRCSICRRCLSSGCSIGSASVCRYNHMLCCNRTNWTSLQYHIATVWYSSILVLIIRASGKRVTDLKWH